MDTHAHITVGEKILLFFEANPQTAEGIRWCHASGCNTKVKIWENY